MTWGRTRSKFGWAQRSAEPKEKKQRTCPFYDYITFANGNKFLGHRHRREKIARVEFTSYRHCWVRVQPLGDLSVDSRQVIERNYRIRNNRTDHVTNVILGIRLFFFSSLTQPHLVLSTSSLPPLTTTIPPSFRLSLIATSA